MQRGSTSSDPDQTAARSQVSAWQAALLAVLVGLAMAGIGFCIMHDANHGSYSDNPRTNRFLGG